MQRSSSSKNIKTQEVELRNRNLGSVGTLHYSLYSCLLFRGAGGGKCPEEEHSI
jgi:hypothetical protein